MSIDPKALQRMMDAYADGRLDATEMSALVEHLRTSEAARE
ncbi:MAG: zf-HC2 domain-containing protein, partial [Verrucomicrobia bacterium]|nr:zf-HC2 domain-containing protein [Verrucomicrobiota bacterium]